MNSYAINLYQKKKNKVADRLLYFILYYFRYIIVITQIVVIAVFFFRFREDQKVIDLKDAFRQRQQILAVTSPIIDEANELAERTEKVEEHLVDQAQFTSDLNYILGSIPQDVVLIAISYTESSFTVSGTSANVFSVRSLHRKLSLREGFEEAVIVSVDRSNASVYTFLIEIPLDVKKKNG